MSKKQWHWEERDRESENKSGRDRERERERTLNPFKTCTASLGAPAAVVQARSTSTVSSWIIHTFHRLTVGAQNAGHM